MHSDAGCSAPGARVFNVLSPPGRGQAGFGGCGEDTNLGHPWGGVGALGNMSPEAHWCSPEKHQAPPSLSDKESARRWPLKHTGTEARCSSSGAVGAAASELFKRQHRRLLPSCARVSAAQPPLRVQSIHPTHTGKSRRKQVCKKLLFVEDDCFKVCTLHNEPFVPREGMTRKAGVASCRRPGHTAPATPHLHSFLTRPHPRISYANVKI